MTKLRLDHTFFENETRPHLGALLVQQGLLRPEQLDRALDVQRGTGRRLGDVLIELGFVFEQDIARAIAIQNDVPYLDLQASSVDPLAARRMRADVGEWLRAIPVRFEDDALLVAVADPFETPRRTLVAETGCKVRVCVADPSEIAVSWSRLQRGQRM